jgi:hypothetical protein
MIALPMPHLFQEQASCRVIGMMAEYQWFIYFQNGRIRVQGYSGHHLHRFAILSKYLIIDIDFLEINSPIPPEW